MPRFEKQNLGEALFHDVNLAGARFEDVNLERAVIRRANLAGMAIEKANICGLTIDGLLIEPLIQSELDRREPERVRLRMADPFDPQSVCRVVARLDVVRSDSISRLRSAPCDWLRSRPAADSWSALEHVRHLVFAEDLYLNRWILRNQEPWTRLGLLPAFLASAPGYAEVGSDPCEDLERIVSAWERIHCRLRDVLAELSPERLRADTSDIDFGQGTVGGVLQGMAQHDLHHLRKAEAALATVSGKAPLPGMQEK